MNVITKLKVETFNQRKKQIDLRGVSSFVGLINKADYTLDLGKVQVQPRFKSEFRRERPALKREVARRDLTETLFLITRFPVLNNTVIELGVELSHFEQFRDEEGVPVDRRLTPDSNSRVLAIQFGNTSDYLGYSLHVQTGFRWQKSTFEFLPDATTSTVFTTVYAGLGQ